LIIYDYQVYTEITDGKKKMHILQPKHIKLSKEEADKLLTELNISKSQLPKILSNDAGLPEGCAVGDVIKLL